MIAFRTRKSATFRPLEMIVLGIAIYASRASASCDWLSSRLRGSPSSERINSTRASGSWLDKLWSAERQLLPMSGLRAMIGALDWLFIFRPIASQSIRLSSTRMTKSSLGKRLNKSRASGPLCAVRTLNLAVSRSNFRVERACTGSGSATSRVGLGMFRLMNSSHARLADNFQQCEFNIQVAPRSEEHTSEL